MQMPHLFRLTTVIGTLAWICFAAQTTWAGLLSFESLVDNTGSLRSFAWTSLNDAGQVAYWARRDDGTQAIFRREPDGSTTTIADTADGVLMSFNSSILSMSESGIVATPAVRVAGGSGIYTGTGGALTEIARSINAGGDFSFLGRLAVNSQGRVVFKGNRAGVEGIYSGSGGTITPLITENDGITGSGGFGDPRINDNDVAAFWVEPDSGPRKIFTITGPDGTLAEYVKDGDPGLSSINAITSRIDLNDDDVVFFRALRSGNAGTAFFTDAGPGVDPVRRTQLNFPVTGSGDLAFNNSHDILLDSPNFDALYDGNEMTPVRILGVGDSLFGSTIQSVDMHPESFNNKGEFTFFYRLENGVSGIAKASAAPEPGIIFLLAVAASAFGVVAMRGRSKAHQRNG